MPKRRKGGRGYYHRRVNVREVRQRFLIVCEGEKTEPLYFEQFRAAGIVIQVEGLGKDPLRLVEEAQRVRKEDDFDQMWCVFDRDDVPVERFNQALAHAQRYKIKVAYSNQAFELWHVLHYHYCDTAMTRQDYISRLGQQLMRPYKKNDATLYETLLPNQANAIRNAERLLEQYSPPQPAYDDPSTTVHELVKELNRFSQR
jgi:hypothetical protein